MGRKTRPTDPPRSEPERRDMNSDSRLDVQKEYSRRQD